MDSSRLAALHRPRRGRRVRACEPTMTMKLLPIAAWLSLALADVSHVPPRPKDADAAIVRQEFDVSPDGGYAWSFDTSNGISAKEEANFGSIGPENEEKVVQGSASWTAPNGEAIVVQYVADNDGYHPQGSHIPTPPPIPLAIERALAYIAEHPPPPGQYNN